MSPRLPDEYFADMYAQSPDPWRLAERWYEQRKYAITVAMLPMPEYRHAFEPGCSVGVLTELLSTRCARVTATDIVPEALAATGARLRSAGRSGRVILRTLSLDEAWPEDDFDLVVLSEVAYYLSAGALHAVLDRECSRLTAGTTVVASHWRHPVEDYPLSGDEADAVIAATPGLQRVAAYRDDDVVISVFAKGFTASVATLTDVPGAVRVSAEST